MNRRGRRKVRQRSGAEYGAPALGLQRTCSYRLHLSSRLIRARQIEHAASAIAERQQELVVGTHAIKDVYAVRMLAVTFLE